MTDSFKILDTVEPGGLPVINDLEYATAAARIADTTLEARHVGKIALQADDGTLWRVEQVSPCLKWKIVSGRWVTYAVEIWYVNHDTGNDTTGNGTASYPYKSLHCLDELPVLLHDLKIRMAASNNYDYFPSFLLHEAYDGGRVIIDASGETFTVDAGPFTVGSVSGVGDAFEGVATATDVTVTPDPSWTPNEYYPRYIHVLDGNYEDYCLPIFKHDNDTIRTSSNWWGLAPGDTFNIVRPPVVITIPGDTTIRGNSVGYQEYRGGGVKEAPFTPTLLMAGVELRCNGTRDLFGPIKIENCAMVANFCTLMNEYWEGGNNVDVVYQEHSSLNQHEIPATFDHTELDDWYDFHTWLATHENEPHHEGYPDLHLNNSVAVGICCRGGIGIFDRVSYLCGGHCSYSLAGTIWKSAVGVGTMVSIFLEQVDYPAPSQGPSIRSNYQGDLVINGVYIESCTIPIKLDGGGRVNLYWLKGNVSGVSSDYALEIDEESSCIIYSAANVTLLGQVGAVDFLFTGTQYAAWPTTGNRHIDTDNSIVITK